MRSLGPQSLLPTCLPGSPRRGGGDSGSQRPPAQHFHTLGNISQTRAHSIEQSHGNSSPRFREGGPEASPEGKCLPASRPHSCYPAELLELSSPPAKGSLHRSVQARVHPLLEPQLWAWVQGCEREAQAGPRGGVNAGLRTIKRKIASQCGADI